MSPFAVSLSERGVKDIAAFYASLPRLSEYHPGDATSALRIVINGAPMRGIAPCGSCHCALDNKTGSPWLEGQPAAYVKAQLLTFRSGERRNDISQQTRNIARALSDEEIAQAATWYASQPGEPVNAITR